MVPLPPRKLFNYTKRVLWKLTKLQNLLLLLKLNKKPLRLLLNLLSPRRRLKILKPKDQILINHQRMLQFKPRMLDQRKTVVWLFQSKPLRNQKVLIKLKNSKLWKKLSKKLLKKPTNKELN